MQTFVSMFYSLVLLIKTINTYMLSVYGVMFHLFQEILTKKKQLAEAEVAEAEEG